MDRRSKVDKAARARRDYALGRPELRLPSVPRVAAAGATSAALKAADPEAARLVAEFEARKLSPPR